MVDALMPTVAMFKSLIQRVFYPTIDRIGKITSPILFIRGVKDEIVPSHHSEVLYQNAKSAAFKELYSCDEGDHNRTWQIGGDDYVAALRNFFQRCEAQN